MASVYSAGSPFDDFYALYVVDVDGEVEGEVTCVGIGDVDAVEKDGELVFCAAVDADVGLYAEGSALADIDSCYLLEQVVDGLCA